MDLYKDTQMGREFLSLTLHASKTDPFREGVTLCLYATGQALCPIASMKAYLARVHHKDLATQLSYVSNGLPLTCTLL